jgi:hypothetical protein
VFRGLFAKFNPLFTFSICRSHLSFYFYFFLPISSTPPPPHPTHLHGYTTAWLPPPPLHHKTCSRWHLHQSCVAGPSSLRRRPTPPFSTSFGPSFLAATSSTWSTWSGLLASVVKTQVSEAVAQPDASAVAWTARARDPAPPRTRRVACAPPPLRRDARDGNGDPIPDSPRGIPLLGDGDGIKLTPAGI